MWNNIEDGGGFGKSRFDQSGGGFLNSSVAASPSGAEKKKAGRLSNVVPCTVAQIHMMPESDENLKIGSLSANIVILIGLVRSVDVLPTKVTYVIDDYTGPGIEVQMWIGENDEQNKKVNVVHENTYARVTGAIRSMKGKRHILGFNVQPVKDFNEISMHMAEVVHTAMAVAVMDKQSSTGGGFNSTSIMTPGMTASTDTFSSNDSRKLTRPQQLVKQAIINCKNEEGIDVMEIYNNLKSLNRQSIQEALEFLCNEGHIYSTIDEDHYKSTDCV